MPGFCRRATTKEITTNGYILTPGRYVGAEEVEDDDEPFDEKIRQLTRKLEGEFAEAARLETVIRSTLKVLQNGE